MSERYLRSNIGFFHADHLHRTGDMDYAHRVTEANLQICERNHWADDISHCHRVLGDLDFDSGNHEFRPCPLRVRAQDCAEYFGSLRAHRSPAGAWEVLCKGPRRGGVTPP